MYKVNHKMKCGKIIVGHFTLCLFNITKTNVERENHILFHVFPSICAIF